MTPEEKKLYLWIGGAAVLGAVVWFASSSNTNGATGGAFDPTGNGSTIPTPVFNAHNVATDLYNAMKDSGTDEGEIMDILTPVTPAQFALVFKAFGKLNYNPTFGNQYALPFQTLTKYDLKYWLKSELSVEDYKTLKYKYPNIL